MVDLRESSQIGHVDSQLEHLRKIHLLALKNSANVLKALQHLIMNALRFNVVGIRVQGQLARGDAACHYVGTLNMVLSPQALYWLIPTSHQSPLPDKR